MTERAAGARRSKPRTSDLGVLNKPSVDFLLLADRAEALNGKLYMMGGAWDRVSVQDLQSATFISLAVGILVPWNATNQQHRATIGIEDEDGNNTGFSVEAGFTAGRPAFARAGQSQRVVLALPLVPVRFPEYGTYVAQMYINDEKAKSIEFNVTGPAGKGM